MNKLREAAQAVIDTVDIHGVYRPEILAALDALRDALAEDRLQEMQGLTESEYAVLAEREACARVVEEPWQGSPKEIAAAIRARGNT